MQSQDWHFSYRDSCVVHTYSLLFPFLFECYSSFPFHFVFFHIWDLGCNSLLCSYPTASKNFIKQNKFFEFKHLNFSFQVTELGATETMKFHYFITLGTIVIWKNYYIKTIILNGFVPQIREYAFFGLYAFHYNLTSTLFEHSSFGMFLFLF